MQRFLAALAFLLALPALGEVHFVAPAAGAQLLGRQEIEVATDVANVNRVEFFVDGALAGVARSAPWRITHDFGLAPEARTIEAKVWSDAFRNVVAVKTVTAAIAASESIDVDLVEVPLRIRATKKLRASDIRIRENGRDQAIRELMPQRGAAQFVFLVDRSLSMGGGRLDATLRAIDDARRLLRAGDSASIVLFNHNVSPRRALGASEKVAQLFSSITPSGGTSLRDALASLPDNDRTYAIVVSDGSDRNSQVAEEDALREISGTRTVVDAVVFGTPSRFLERAAANTGGAILRAQPGNVSSQLQQILADINSRYVAVYQSSGGKRGWRTIAVTARSGGVSVMNARKGYFAR